MVVDDRPVPVNDPGLLELADAVTHGWRREVHPLGYRGVRSAAIFAENLENLSVRRVEIHDRRYVITRATHRRARQLVIWIVRILFIGDIFGRPGREAASRYLSRKRAEFDLVIANGENATSGRGLNRRHYRELRDAGIDLITLGNHAWDQSDTAELLEESPRLIRAANYPAGTPGVELALLEAPSGERLAVAQLLGQVFMNPVDDPFAAADRVVEQVPAGVPLLVDVHAEATSEKLVLGYHLRGRAAAVLGTHTHVQTADERIRQGTAYITDAGMTGVQDSAIGMAYEEVHWRFTTGRPRRYRPAEGDATVCGVSLVLEGTACTDIERIRWQE